MSKMTAWKTYTAAALAALMLMAGCNSGGGSNVTIPPATGTVSSAVAVVSPTPTPTPISNGIWQNPFLSANPTSNIHNDSYLSDSYSYAGPTAAVDPTIDQLNVAEFTDPYSGQPRLVALGECGSLAFDADGNIQTYSAGIPDPLTNKQNRSIVTVDRRTLRVLAFIQFSLDLSQSGGLTDFGGAGYFYQDNQHRMVVGLPDGHTIQVLQRTPSDLSDVDRYVAVRSFDALGNIPIPSCATKLSLYALMPDKAGNIWFTTAQGVVGTISLNGEIHWVDLNAPNGTCQPQPDGDFQKIANSHAIDEGDSEAGPSGVYILTTHQLYRMQTGADGTPQIAWQQAYDHGTIQKPGQVSFGSGSSPTVFKMGGRRFVTIVDNADFMHSNVYRAEVSLRPGEQRLFAQTVAFPNITPGTNGAAANAQAVSDENSEIVSPAPDNSGGVDIFTENNWGYTAPSDVTGSQVLAPGGLSRLRLLPDGTFTAASINPTISVPTIVSKISIPSGTVYTYDKQASGWYLTALDAIDLTRVKFSVLAGPGENRYNNHYSALSVDADGKTVYLGTLFGLTRIRVDSR